MAYTTIGLVVIDIKSEIELLTKDMFGKLNGITMKSNQSPQVPNAGELSTELNHAIQQDQLHVKANLNYGTSKLVITKEIEFLLQMETSMLLKIEMFATTQNTTMVIGTLH